MYSKNRGDREQSRTPREGRPSFDKKDSRKNGKSFRGEGRGTYKKDSGERDFKKKSFGNNERRFEGKSFGRDFQKREGGFGGRSFDRNSEKREGGFERKDFDRERKSFGRNSEKREGGFERKGFDRERKSFGRNSEDREGGFERKDFDRERKRSERASGRERKGDRKKIGSGMVRNMEAYDEYDQQYSKSLEKQETIKKDPRLNKYIANAGICSRRDADKYIVAGNVTVNGEVVKELGFRVKAGDEVRFDGELLNSEKKEYILLNKPKGFITTTQDEKGRKTVMDLVAGATKVRINPVGRLDRQTTGLLLLTNDGDLTKKLTHPSYGVRKIYHVVLDRNLDLADFHKIQNGVTLEDGFVEVDDISYVDGGTRREVGVKIHSGRNRIVRRIFESVGYEVEKLDRVSFAGLTKKDLPRGSYRYLTQQEIINLKNLN